MPRLTSKKPIYTAGYEFLGLGVLIVLLLQVFGSSARAQSAPEHPPALSGNVLIDSGAGEKAPKDVRPADLVHWDSDVAKVYPNGKVLVPLRLRTDQEFTLYKDRVRFEGMSGYTVESVSGPETTRIVDPMSGLEVDVYTGGIFNLTLYGPAGAKPEQFQVKATYTACTKVICLFPYTEVVTLKTFIEEKNDDAANVASNQQSASIAGRAVASGAGGAARAVASGATKLENNAVPAVDTPAEEDLESRLAANLKKSATAGSVGMGMLLLIAFIGGLLTNLTPCVAPMIPITIRLLAGHTKSPLLASSLYALGILVTYTLLGLFAALSGGLFGSLLASTTFSLIFAGVMILLGLSMLGFGDFSRLQTLGSRLGSGAPSKLNTFLMGTGAGLVASPCTGPILAALLAYTAKSQDVSQSTLLLMTYSLGFALPYVFLGGAAAKIKKVKVSFRVQIAVKLIFAAVMFALGLYYLRVPAYGFFIQLKSYWPMITSLGLGLGVLATAAWIMLPVLHNQKISNILPSAILAVGVFAATQWLTHEGSSAEGHAEAAWLRNEGDAFAAAKSSGKPLLVDAWAEWCEACKKMDLTTFRDQAVVELLADKWILLKLDLTESNEVNEKLQEKYELQSLPTLTLVPSDGDLGRKEHVTGYVSAGTLLSRLRAYRRE